MMKHDVQLSNEQIVKKYGVNPEKISEDYGYCDWWIADENHAKHGAKPGDLCLYIQYDKKYLQFNDSIHDELIRGIPSYSNHTDTIETVRTYYFSPIKT